MQAVARGRRPKISYDDVVRAGLEITRASGFAAVSMEALAIHLGMSTRAMYNHVDGIGHVRRAVITAMMAEPIEVPDDLAPREFVAAYAQAVRERYLEYPGVATALFETGWLIEPALLHVQRCAAKFEAAGIGHEEALMHAVTLLWWVSLFATREDAAAPHPMETHSWDSLPGEVAKRLASITLDQLFEFEVAKSLAVLGPAGRRRRA